MKQRGMQATLPTNDTNLSRFGPPIAKDRAAHRQIKTTHNRFFCILTFVSGPPERLPKIPCPTILGAGESMRGTERMMASEYRISTVTVTPP